MFTLYQEAFFKQHQELQKTLQSLAQEPCDASKDSAGTIVNKADEDMVSAIGNLNILGKISTFEAANSSDPMFKVMRHYMRMVIEMLAFIRSCPNRRLVTTPDNSREVQQVHLCPLRKKLFSYDSGVPCSDVILESIRSRNL